MREVALEALSRQHAPVEYEADVRYPGAPTHRAALGGDTVRRLLQAYDRHPAFAEWTKNSRVTDVVGALLNSAELRLTRNHHNCIMTKHPGFSSATLWHQDLRYWSFSKPDLINSWLALGHETSANGCMWLLPGSHRCSIAARRLDSAKFLRSDLPENQTLLHTARSAELQPGDVLFFHAGVFHAAGRNETGQLKLSAVFTYHDANNIPTPGTRSARYESIAVAGC